ncbi:response regulator [Alteromonas pelagimontana]|uniref:histidine kinase n=1 Tax=Alteromonas pelagimontana TaxID=1858656 RepID=A0A6M4MAJ5_9ALTE|nr:ATP-binding protein [Alteromonas pelagimontana]QJR80183.1 response regulator [Alteromonas pelagimontana]
MNFIHDLQNIVSNQQLDFDEKVQKLLSLGLLVFGLDIGLVSRVQGTNYTVLFAQTPDNSLTAGTSFDLEGTYCVHTLEANSAISFHQASETDIAEHPCYKNFGLESYIGAPIRVGELVFGTVNFSSAKASKPFTETHIDYVELLAQWLGSEYARKESVSQLVQANKMLNKLENVAKIGSWEVDLATDKITWSDQTRKIHEVASDYVPELNSAIQFYKDRSRDTVTKAVESAVAHGEDWNLEVELITAKGKNIWVSTHGSAEFEDGQCKRLFGTFQDITEAVTLRNELKKQKIEAELALRDRSILFAKVSHELRTPLNGITGMLTALVDEGNAERRKEMLQVALRSSDNLLKIINEVLDYSKLSHGSMKLEPSHFLLKTSFVDLASMYLPLFTKKSIDFFVNLDISDSCWVYVDSTRLSQIVSNLLSNSLKFTDKGEVKLTASAKGGNGKVHLAIVIEDTGVGMTQPFLKSIFTPFRQDIRDISVKNRGTGLGLSIVKELVDMMGGSINVQSEKNIGSTFRVELTVATGQEDLSDRNDNDTALIDGSRLNVLVVDDNEINRLVMEASLNKFHITPDFAVDGRDAVYKCEENSYDLIFMDCVMPELDGLDATRILRQRGLVADETVIAALTANTADADKQACKKAGMNLFIAKPFKMKSIYTAVESALAKINLR